MQRPETQNLNQSEATRAASAFLVWGGFSTALVGFIVNWWPLSGWRPVRLVGFGLGAVAAGVVLRGYRTRVSMGFMRVLILFFIAYIGVGVVLAAGSRNFGPMFLLWPVLLSFAYFPRRWAVEHAGLALVVLAAVFALQPGWPVPFVYWIFLAVTILATAWIVSGLVERADAARRDLALLNRSLEEKVRDQVGELERLGRLRRFLPVPVMRALLAAQNEDVLEPHRRQIAVLFCDLRGFTRFASTAAPEEVTELLGEYHAAIGRLVAKYEATVGALAGDGVMIYFNDPMPCDAPCERAVLLARDLAEPMMTLVDNRAPAGLLRPWRGHRVRLRHAWRDWVRGAARLHRDRSRREFGLSALRRRATGTDFARRACRSDGRRGDPRSFRGGRPQGLRRPHAGAAAPSPVISHDHRIGV